MKTKILFSISFVLLVTAPRVWGQGTAFTYQGRLTGGANPVNGTYDLRFALYDDPTGGAQWFQVVTNLGVAVSNGLFTTTVDFRAGPFNGTARWLEIAVRTNRGTTFSLLWPRQPLTATPYALYATNANLAANATIALGVAPNAVTAGGIADSNITAAKIAPSQVVKTVNQLKDDVLLGAGSNITMTIMGNMIVVSSPTWSLSGNSGTSPGANYLGTADNQPLEFKVNSRRALRLEPTVNDGSHSNIVNVVGGSPANSIAPGVYGSVIAGGGAANSYSSSPAANSVSTDFSFLGGGVANSIQPDSSYCFLGGGAANSIQPGAWYCFLGGGGANSIQTNCYSSFLGGGYLNYIWTDAYVSFLGGGAHNSIQTNSGYSFLGGGSLNTILPNGTASVLAGGWDNTIGEHAGFSFLGGGSGNSIQGNAEASFLGGGWDNSVQPGAGYSFLGGGSLNVIQSNATNSFLGGGYGNSIGTNAIYSAIDGGVGNTIETYSKYATIGGGNSNTIQIFSYGATISGGRGNTIQTNANNATIGGGYNNTASHDYATIGGGTDNAIQRYASASTIGGGEGNRIQTDSSYVTIGGGWRNTIQTNAIGSTIGGGDGNTIQANTMEATIGGGWSNSIQGNATRATIGGGWGNTVQANATYATIPGGLYNVAGGSYSFAAGLRAKTTKPGSFVWGDSNNFDILSNGTNEFVVRATGGFFFFTAVDGTGYPTSGAVLLAGSGSWSSWSDRNSKDNFQAADSRDVLERLVAVPMQTWNYRSQDKSIRHIGPMAQDFKAAFGVGEDDKHIATIDADGVALAAIQGLNQKVEEQHAALLTKDARIAALEQRLSTLEHLIQSTLPKGN